MRVVLAIQSWLFIGLVTGKEIIGEGNVRPLSSSSPLQRRQGGPLATIDIKDGIDESSDTESPHGRALLVKEEIWDSRFANLQIPKSQMTRATDHTMVSDHAARASTTTRNENVDDHNEESSIEDVEPKYFVFHIGPARSASTTIQSAMMDAVTDGSLEEDNYVLIGGDNTTSRLGLAIQDAKCMEATKDAVHSGGSTPSCWDDVLTGLKELRGRNVLVSTANIGLTSSTPVGWLTDAGWWQALANAAMEHAHLSVVVIGAYRRLYQWLPSAHVRYSQQYLGGDWPQHGGTEPETLYPVILHSDKIDRLGGWKLWYPWISDYRDCGLSDYVDFRVINLHDDDERPIEVKFFCDFVPNAPKSCARSYSDEMTRGRRLRERELELNEDHELSHQIFYDHLARAAARDGLVDIEQYSRDQVIEEIANYQENVLYRSGNGFPMDCPQRKDARKLMGASVAWESEFFPEIAADINKVHEHMRMHWEAHDDFKLCSLDTAFTLQLDEWASFFQDNFNTRRPTVEEKEEDDHDDSDNQYVEERPLDNEVSLDKGVNETLHKTNAADSKYFVIHLGPPKTASTTIQASIAHVQDTYLEDDGYYYIGKHGDNNSQLARALHDEWCNRQVRGPENVPTCWNNMIDGINELRDLDDNSNDDDDGTSILMSSESINVPEWSTSTEWWAALNATASQHGFRLFVIAVYRRLYEWLLSVHYQYTQGQFVANQPWPEHGGKTYPPLIPLIFESEYVVNHANSSVDGRKLWYRWIPTYIDEIPDNIEMRILNLHDEDHTIETKFFCDMMPDTSSTCEYNRQRESSDGNDRMRKLLRQVDERRLVDESVDFRQESISGVGSSSSYAGALYYDFLATAAADAGLVNTTQFRRSEVYAAIKEHQENVLKRTVEDFPLHCASQTQLETLLDASLSWEQMILNRDGGQATTSTDDDMDNKHRERFWDTVRENRFCTINTTATMDLDEWRHFFEELRK